MTAYAVTTANWDDPSFWSSINEGAGGHTLDFSQLPSNYSVIYDANGAITSISDGTTSFTIGEPGTVGTDANLGGSTDWSFFNAILGSQGDDDLTGGAGDDDINGGAGSDSLTGGGGNDVLRGDNAPGAAGERLTNGSFDGDLSGWTIINPTGGQAPEYAAGDDFVRLNSGDEAAGGDGLSQEFGTIVGETYSTSVDLEQNGASAGNHTVLVEILDENGTVTDSVTTVIGQGGSDTVEIDFVATSEVSEIRITNPSSTATVNTDVAISNVSVVGLDPADAPGDDTLVGDAGDDLILGGGGADSIEGGADNDTLYGDSAIVRESLNYEDLTTAEVRDGVTINTGNVNVTFNSPTETGITLETSDASSPYTGGINDDGSGVDPDSVLQSRVTSSSSLGEYNWVFSEAVTNVSFNIVDLDDFENIQILAFDADNNPIDVTLTPGSNVSVSDSNGDGFDDLAEGSGSGGVGDASHAVTVSIPGPVARIEAVHTIDSSGGLAIQFTEMFFDAVAPGTTDGNDTIDGGAGDDVIFGEGGNDTLDGGIGADTVTGGSGNDTITGDAGNDDLRGGTGDDSIDGGDGNDTIYGDGAIVRESLNYEDLTTAEVRDGVTINTGNVNITFNSPIETGVTLETSDTSSPYTGGIVDDGSGVDPDSVLESTAANSGSRGEYNWVFSEEVTNVSFNIVDFDEFENMQILAFDADNNPIEVTLTPGNNVAVSDSNGDGFDDLAEGSGSGGVGDASHAVTVSIPGPVARIEAVHTMDGSGGLGLLFTEMFFDAVGPGTTDGNDTIDGGAGDDLIFGEGGNDTLDGGIGADTIAGDAGDDMITGDAGNDTIFGDAQDESIYGTLNPQNTDNLQDSSGTEANNIRAIDLVELPNGDLIMITSETGGSDDGIATYRVDDDPSSANYGQIIGGQIDTLNIGNTLGSGQGYDRVEDIETVTLAGGSTFVYTADSENDALGIAELNSDGTLTQLSPMSSAQYDDVSDLTSLEVGGQSFLVMLAGGSADRMTAFQVNNDGTVVQTDVVTDGSGGGENYLNNGAGAGTTVLESFSNSSGQNFIIAGGEDDGISLWTLDGAGQFTFQNARGDDQAGAGESDPQGNDLGRDLASPADTGLTDVDAAVFAEIDGQTYLFTGGGDDDVDIFRIDPDTVNGDGTFDLTLVGHFDNVVNGISAMEFLQTDDGPVLVIGGEDSGLRFYSTTVNPDGTVDITLTDTVADGSEGAAELSDSEALDVAGGLLVSASDNDDGVAIIDTGLNPTPQFPGDDTIDGGTGDDALDGGGGSDTFLLSDGYGNDTISGGEDDGDADQDAIDASGVTADGVDVFLSGNENGTVTSTEGTANFSEIESFTLTDQADTFQGANNSTGVTVDGGGGDDSLVGGSGDDTLEGGAGNDTLFAGDSGTGGDSLTGGTGDDVLISSFGNSTLDGGEGSDLLEVGYGSSTVVGGNGAGDVDTLSAIEADDRLSVSFDGTGFGTFDDLTDSDAGEFSQIEAVEGSSGADSINAAADSGGLELSGNGGNDTITGGSGDDTLDGGDGSDAIVGGDGNDYFTYTAGDGLDTITDFNTGNTGTLDDGDSTNNDSIDLGAFYDNIAELQDDYADDGILNQSNEGNFIRGQTVDYGNNTSFDTNGTPDDEGIVFTGQTPDGNSFTQENTGVLCFAAGTRILTPRGEVPVEELGVGDLVLTLDDGPQPLVWTGATALNWSRDPDDQKPILFKAGSLGPNMPARDLTVSPQHRVLLPSKGHDKGVFAPAKALVDLPKVRQMTGCRSIVYHHIMLAKHQVLVSNDVPSESFYPGEMALQMMVPDLRASAMRAVMMATQGRGIDHYALARDSLSVQEALATFDSTKCKWTEHSMPSALTESPDNIVNFRLRKGLSREPAKHGCLQKFRSGQVSGSCCAEPTRVP